MPTKSADFPRTLNIGILVFEDFEPLDVWGFIEAFAISRFIGTGYATTSPLPFKIHLIANEDKQRVSHPKQYFIGSYNGPRVVPDLFRDEALGQAFDLLMIPGGRGVNTLLESVDKARGNNPDTQNAELTLMIDWLKAMDNQVPIMTSVCTGAAILACAGLLDGHPATTNHMAFPWVTGFGPRVLWNNVSRWVDAGKYVTSAGVSAGTDMAFNLVARLAGRAVAETAAIAAEYDWKRDAEEPIYYPPQANVPMS